MQTISPPRGSGRVCAASRSAINTMGQANDLIEAIDSTWLGVTVDVYHLWWDPSLESEIAEQPEPVEDGTEIADSSDEPENLQR